MGIKRITVDLEPEQSTCISHSNYRLHARKPSRNRLVRMPSDREPPCAIGYSSYRVNSGPSGGVDVGIVTCQFKQQPLCKLSSAWHNQGKIYDDIAVSCITRTYSVTIRCYNPG
jgi:hypothetical protein